ncbi:hypothetical protein K469DRAFT_693880 [Zopfia rhizophila CBS 207.26]|uniref:Uncharacterized protein n=1 Tax=Zopfia rhizophila CBS 207.26 TaxID=1314779 RepID=A0A6A6DMM9_9PEZI|nr:hypothetical protein K469DRAFT_693880 [Zopfia rhizophila CBS 207.26]
MSSDLHDTVAAEIWSDIYDQLKEVRKRTDRYHESAIDATNGIKAKGTSKIKFPVSKGKMDGKSPDSAFQHRDLWRAEVDELNSLKRVAVMASVLNKEFRDEDGNTVTGADLQLSLRDFTCEKVARKFQDIQDPEIVVLLETLCTIYEDAVAFQQMTENGEKGEVTRSEESDQKEGREHRKCP